MIFTPIQIVNLNEPRFLSPPQESKTTDLKKLYSLRKPVGQYRIPHATFYLPVIPAPSVGRDDSGLKKIGMQDMQAQLPVSSDRVNDQMALQLETLDIQSIHI
jgi:hypothetical protein